MVWGLFTDLAMFAENAAASYANPFILADGRVVAHVKASEWSGETLPHAEAVALIDTAPIDPPPEPAPGPGA